MVFWIDTTEISHSNSTASDLGQLDTQTTPGRGITLPWRNYSDSEELVIDNLRHFTVQSAEIVGTDQGERPYKE
ncbi:hypothetical protein DE4587_01899 [Mycobacteroides salmoniphilum]|nr:hypothetical protein DE4586_03057 [Mycobacteroides salmoniphilum]TDZ86975.1 hypothetical protein DE4587_01899 [Mycobacteroides salmoniphilum]